MGSSLERNGKILAPLLTRDAVLPILSLLSMARENGCKVSELSLSLPARFTASDRLQNFPAETSRVLLQNLAASTVAIEELLSGLCGKPTGQDQTDGLRIFLETMRSCIFGLQAMRRSYVAMPSRPVRNEPKIWCRRVCSA